MVAWVGEEGDAPEYAAYGTTKGPVCECRRALSDRCRRRPTLPRPLGRSTIGAVGLNDRVRDGNGCGPYALVASDIRRTTFRFSVCRYFGELLRVSGCGWSRDREIEEPRNRQTAVTHSDSERHGRS